MQYLPIKVLPIMRLGIPIWADRISPVFDEACRLMLVEIDGSVIIERKIIDIRKNSLPVKAGYIKDHSVNLIFCGAVSEEYLIKLSNIGIEVIPWLTGSVEEIISAYLNGILFDSNEFVMPGCRMCRRRRRRNRQGAINQNLP